MNMTILETLQAWLLPGAAILAVLTTIIMILMGSYLQAGERKEERIRQIRRANRSQPGDANDTD